jgi:hypothetical protein
MATKKEKIKADSKGSLAFQNTLQPWTCVLIKEI